jgi:hypothetical protein
LPFAPVAETLGFVVPPGHREVNNLAKGIAPMR